MEDQQDKTRKLLDCQSKASDRYIPKIAGAQKWPRQTALSSLDLAGAISNLHLKHLGITVETEATEQHSVSMQQ